ncbi:MAG: Nif11-like leader peptide family RiPP precursor [Acidobacteriota bacterium]|nr:Nif11-like leader peptide family RiPP precursor [Acidobacteriota bacterium]
MVDEQHGDDRRIVTVTANGRVGGETMSKENLEQFMKQVAESEDLQSRMGDEIAGDDLAALGAEHGWEFSIEDLQASAELSDEELERVAGGVVIIGTGSWLTMRGGRFSLKRVECKAPPRS